MLIIEKSSGKVIYADKNASEIYGVDPIGLEMPVLSKILNLNGRTLKLESLQMLDLQEYISTTRPAILKGEGIYKIGRKPDSINLEKAQRQLFISMHGSDIMKNSFLHLLYSLRKLNPKLINAGQIRQSVITIWLKTKDLRTTQYMAGHRYVSSTERYQVNQLDDLQDALNQFHPLA